MHIAVNKENSDQYIVTIAGQIGAPDVEKALANLIGDSIQSIKFTLKASHASAYLLIQMLAMLRKEKKSISVEWIDHKPSITILSIIESIVK